MGQTDGRNEKGRVRGCSKGGREGTMERGSDGGKE